MCAVNAPLQDRHDQQQGQQAGADAAGRAYPCGEAVVVLLPGLVLGSGLDDEGDNHPDHAHDQDGQRLCTMKQNLSDTSGQVSCVHLTAGPASLGTLCDAVQSLGSGSCMLCGIAAEGQQRTQKARL